MLFSFSDCLLATVNKISMVIKLTVQQVKFYLCVLLLMIKISQEASNDWDSYCEITRSIYRYNGIKFLSFERKKGCSLVSTHTWWLHLHGSLVEGLVGGGYNLGSLANINYFFILTSVSLKIAFVLSQPNGLLPWVFQLLRTLRTMTSLNNYWLYFYFLLDFQNILLLLPSLVIKKKEIKSRSHQEI